MKNDSSNASKSELMEDIQKLGSSPHFLKLADSILSSLDRQTLAELTCTYLYLKSKGKTDNEIAKFIFEWKTGKALHLIFNAFFATVPGLVSDEKFRRVIFTFLEELLMKQNTRRVKTL